VSDVPKCFGALVRGLGLPLLLLVLVMPVQAERADRDKPLNIEADKMQMDDLKQVSVFTGRVVLTKGTIIVRAERLVIKQDPEGYQYGTAYGSAGKTASFRQKREGADQFVEGYGEEIEYDGKAEIVKLKKNALLKRLEKEKPTDEVCGNLIVYESLTELFSADSGPAGACSPNGRVRLVIQPRSGATVAVQPGAAQAVGVPPPTSKQDNAATTLKQSERPNSVK
jgi:lipopolysaccharide export system protein LptA